MALRQSAAKLLPLGSRAYAALTHAARAGEEMVAVSDAHRAGSSVMEVGSFARAAKASDQPTSAVIMHIGKFYCHKTHWSLRYSLLNAGLAHTYNSRLDNCCSSSCWHLNKKNAVVTAHKYFVPAGTLAVSRPIAARASHSSNKAYSHDRKGV